MNKITFRFSLLQARFPSLYEEAEIKIAGGVERKDILADWLNELIYIRQSNGLPIESPVDDFELAKSVMDGLD